MNHKAPIKNDTLLREAYESGRQSLNEQGYWGTPSGAKVNFNRPGGFDGIVYWFPTGDPADGGMIHPDYKGTPGYPDFTMPSGRSQNQQKDFPLPYRPNRKGDSFGMQAPVNPPKGGFEFQSMPSGGGVSP